MLVVQVEGVSVPQLLEALREHCQQWHSAQGESRTKGTCHGGRVMFLSSVD